MTGHMLKPKIHVAVQGVCAWPHLLQLPKGELIATIFNQPTHGGWEGDLDCYISMDEGQTWAFRGRPAPHQPGTNRIHCAAGFARDGNMIVLSSGWDERPSRGTYRPPREGRLIPPWVCRSADGAKTWRQADGAIQQPPGNKYGLIPFGMVVKNCDGTLGVSLYGCDDDFRERVSFFYISRDDGKTWELRSTIGHNLSETNLLAQPDGLLFAIARTHGDMHLELFASTDAGMSWQARGPLSLPQQIPGHMLRLDDGRLLLSYGNRCRHNYGIDARISHDDGETWGAPIRLADRPLSDGGYPSSIQLDDGRIVTVYYRQLTGEFHYDMCVATWNVDE